MFEQRKLLFGAARYSAIFLGFFILRFSAYSLYQHEKKVEYEYIPSSMLLLYVSAMEAPIWARYESER